MRNEVMTWLREQELAGSVRSEHCAKAFCISPVTLRRKLAAEGTTFKSLFDEELRRRFSILIKDDAKLEEITDSLGFHHDSTMTRTFRRVMGITVREARSCSSPIS